MTVYLILVNFDTAYTLCGGFRDEHTILVSQSTSPPSTYHHHHHFKGNLLLMEIRLVYVPVGIGFDIMRVLKKGSTDKLISINILSFVYQGVT